MNERLADVLRKSDEIRRMNADLQRDYREQRIRERAATTRAWFDAHPERGAELRKRVVKKRCATLREAKAECSPDDLLAINCQLAEWRDSPDWRCTYCQKDAPKCDRVGDHVLPLSRGGRHHVVNLAPACRRCNSRKGTASSYFP